MLFATGIVLSDVFLHGDSPLIRSRIDAAGEYNEKAFKALDYILDEASKLGIRVIMTLGDNWVGADSKPIVSFPSPPPPPPPSVIFNTLVGTGGPSMWALLFTSPA